MDFKSVCSPTTSLKQVGFDSPELSYAAGHGLKIAGSGSGGLS